MEFLTTPDLASSEPRWSTVASASVSAVRNPHLTPRALASASTPRNANDSVTASATQHAPPSEMPGAPFATPRTSTAFYASLDRAGIKNSFQSLFSPNVGSSTPALFGRNATNAPGLTPFINGMGTPSLVPPASGMLPNYPPSTHIGGAGPVPSPNGPPAPSPDMLSSPYLQAAAKEAVRREFMNMPSYVSPNGISGHCEREVPAKVVGNRSPHQSTPGSHHGNRGTPSAPPAAVPSMQPSPLPQQVSPTSGDAKVPTRTSPQRPPQALHGDTGRGSPNAPGVKQNSAPGGGPVVGKEEPQPARPTGGVPSHMSSYFMPHPQPPGMVMFGQHGPMMMAGHPPGPMYAAPHGMMMFAGGQPPFGQHGMMMHSQHPHGQMVRPPGQQVKAESQAERKQRIENEKQELIREFKKKTREAALVRFRQKRRERRFGKLIRYDCRKKLADARPRVKGRFVRIKEDEEESESPQVVPDLELQR